MEIFSNLISAGFGYLLIITELPLKKVAIVGGGLAGLVSGIELAKKGVPCVLFEKRKFPFHRVCGEYISNETLPYLKSNGLYPREPDPPAITTFVLSSVRGQTATLPLDLGGFAVSRFRFDHLLFEKARSLGVEILENCEVTGARYEHDSFRIQTLQGQQEADVVIGAFGKRSKMDIYLDRAFIKKRSPYVGIKYHLRTAHPDRVVSLHNFSGGYCGVVNVEHGVTNVCYLVNRDVLQAYKNIAIMEKEVLFKNPLLREVLSAATPLFEGPLVINEISFETKSPVENHILMAGDSAGMITPLCGNGMGMAIHSAKILSDFVVDYCSGNLTRDNMEDRYRKRWNHEFATRLRIGRTVQKLFGSHLMSATAISMIRHFRPLAELIMRQTHGRIF